jgi:hypothetical protein
MSARGFIANAITYYNTLLLSRVYEPKQAADDQEAMNVIKGVSPIAWQHVNLCGRPLNNIGGPNVYLSRDRQK